jgi:hypothetical protein
MTGRAKLQFRFDSVFQASYGDARHGFMIALQSPGTMFMIVALRIRKHLPEINRSVWALV